MPNMMLRRPISAARPMPVGHWFVPDMTMAASRADQPTALPCSGCSTTFERHRINVIVVYKVDRLTRSLADFAKLVELFDAYGVSFVSVTQQFNTTTSMGRLTLNVLLSFAQFEREVTSERIRDKIGASKRKGVWVGGVVPLGYQAKDRKITVVADEAKAVRHIFRRYLDLGSLNLLLTDLRRKASRPSSARYRMDRTSEASRSPAARLPLSCAIASISVRSDTRVRSSAASNPPSLIEHCSRRFSINLTSSGPITPRRGNSLSHC